MKITKVEMIYPQQGPLIIEGEQIPCIWVRIHTDEGITGLGETYPLGEAECGVIRGRFASMLIGQNPLEIERLWQDMFRVIGFHGWAGAELRAISAIDIALWDIYGKAAGQPIYQLLGGKSRDRVRTYNTCYDHRYDFNNVENNEAEKLAKELLDSGVGAMKVWPFDGVGYKNRGQFITKVDMEIGLRPVQQIRDAVGDDIEIALEFHGLWNVPSAIKIAHALEPYNVMWLEEMMPQDNMKAYATVADHVSQPLCISERLMTRYQFRELIELGIAQFIMPDICWCGGITEAHKIAVLADTYYLPIAPHNCGGPVLHAASIHLTLHLTNLFILESVRRHYLVQYDNLVTGSVPVEEGHLTAPETPGLGIDLKPELLNAPGA
ncbi:mandelate racemase/muconate lactonizing enzyme family protein [Candidatus Poribacteria bacterium]|nr:mandelate racemase/muconate lactonizing enzyme family protein [Candidatus Poribacteria bacterium]